MDFPDGTAVALNSRGLAPENHACAEPQACHTDETTNESEATEVTTDAVAAPIIKTCRVAWRVRSET
jgi:hypothetical protein